MNNPGVLDFFVNFIEVFVVGLLLILGLLAGTIVEDRHLASLDRREDEVRGMRVCNLRSFPGAAPAGPQPTLVVGVAVISSDFFRTFMMKLKNIIGGRLGYFERLCDRGRREAYLRMLDEARHAGFDAVCNVRFDTADIVGAGERGNAVATVVVLASGTAYKRR